MIENMTIEELVSEIQGHLTKSRHRPSTPDLIWLRQISACVLKVCERLSKQEGA